MNKIIKSIIQRGLIGALLGIAISYIISILISISNGVGDGLFYPCSLGLLAQFDTELAAVIFQVVMSAIYGFVQGAITVVWDMEKWSFVKQTLIHFLVLFVSTFLFGWLNYWFPHKLTSILVAIGIFLVIYLVCWTIGYFAWKRKIKDLNKKL